MLDLIDFIVRVLSMSWRQFQLLIVGFATLGAGAVFAEIWPFGDKTVVLNTFLTIAMLAASRNLIAGNHGAGISVTPAPVPFSMAGL